MKPLVKAILIGCGSLAAIAFVAVVIGAFFLFTGPEGGVLLGNEMEQYALDYIAQHELLNPDEEVLAYYDVTLGLDGTEAAILTDARVIYHKNGNTTSIPIREIEDVRHRYESFIGDVFEIQGASGRMIKIEVAPLNQGETFKNVLMASWKEARDGATGD